MMLIGDTARGAALGRVEIGFMLKRVDGGWGQTGPDVWRWDTPPGLKTPRQRLTVKALQAGYRHKMLPMYWTILISKDQQQKFIGPCVTAQGFVGHYVFDAISLLPDADKAIS